jgi:hypothetical protein
VIYEAFVEGRLEAPKHLARSVHDLYFEPKYEEFRPRTIWSLACVYLSFQGPRSHPTVQGDCQTGRFPGSAVLAIVLARGAMSTLWLPVQEVLSRHTVDNRKKARIAAGPSLSQQTRSGMIRAQKGNGGETNWASNFWTRTTHSSADVSVETVVSTFSLCTIPGVSEAITGSSSHAASTFSSNRALA